MNFETGLALALVRALIVAAMAVAGADLVTRWLNMAGRDTRRIVAALLVAIVFTPMLVLGYVYSSGDLTLVRYPRLNDLLYGLLLCAKFMPIAVGVLYFGPPAAVSNAGRFCATLVPRDSALSRNRLRMWWSMVMQAHGRAWLLAGIAVFLLSFQEFELASLLNGSSGRQASAYSWTIALHEARELQMPLSVIWMKTLIAVAIQVAAMVVGLRVLMRSERLAAETSSVREGGRILQAIGSIVVLFASVLALVVPWFIVLRTGLLGISSLFASFSFSDELLHSVMFAAASTVLVFAALAWFRAVRARPVVVMVCCVPGLMGGLVLALTLIAAFEPLSGVLCVFELLVDSPLLLLLGLVLWLLPIALLLRWLLGVTEQRSAVHTARLASVASAASGSTSSREHSKRIDQLQWRLQYRGRFWLVMLVFSFAYFELILSVLLAPTSMTGAMALLYNLFHYGQNAVRSAMIIVLVSVPIVLVAACVMLRPALVVLFRAVTPVRKS